MENKKQEPSGRNLNPKHRIFINEMIKHGDKELAYLRAHPNASEITAKANARELYNRPQIKRHIIEAQQRIQQQTEEALVDSLKEELTAMKGIMEVAAAIIGGSMKFEKHFKDSEKPREVKASGHEVLAALNLCFKIAKEMPALQNFKDRDLMVAGRPFK